MPIMISRGIKRTIYGLLYVLLIAGVSAVFYFVPTKTHSTCFDGKRNQGEEEVDCGGPCKSCAVKSLSITVGEKGYFDLARLKKTTFYLEFDNPSADYWVKKFNYTLNVYNNLGAKVASFNGESYIAPSGKRIVAIVAADIDARDIARTDLGIMDPEWSPLLEYHVDGVSVSEVNRQIAAGDKIYISGVATNNVSSIAKKITITAVFRDEEGKIANASATAIDFLQPFSKKNFEIFLTPNQVSEIDLARTEIFTEVTR